MGKSFSISLFVVVMEALSFFLRGDGERGFTYGFNMEGEGN